MRLFRSLLAAGLAAALTLLLPGTASAMEKHVGLHDMSCTGITAIGKGMPPGTTMQLALTDQQRGRTLAKEAVRTSPDGEFHHRLKLKLYDTLSVRLTVSGQDGSRMGFADHVMAKGAPMCNLPFTGPGQGRTLMIAAAALLGLGVVLVQLSGGRHRRARARRRAA